MKILSNESKVQIKYKLLTASRIKPRRPRKCESERKLTNADLSVSVFYFPPEDDEDGPTLKDKAIECFMKGIDVFCVWECCWPWVKFKGWVAFLVFDPFVELFITLCIVVNTLFMALDHHDMDRDMERALKSGNYVTMRIHFNYLLLNCNFKGLVNR